MQEFECTRCGAKVDVIRGFEEANLLPEGDEVSEIPCVGTDGQGEHAWKKIIGTPMFFRGASWGEGRKGSW